MELHVLIYKLRTTPPHILVKRVLSRTRATLEKKGRAARDLRQDTHMALIRGASPRLLLGDAQLETGALVRETAEALADMWCAHRFDLLGSGWVRCGYLDNAPGFEGCRYPGLVLEGDREGRFLAQVLGAQNQKEAQRIWQLIDDPEYMPIDWHKDWKSGYRWDARVWYLHQKWAQKPGGDIKMPWELSRLQHLPRMAVFAQAFPTMRERLFREFRNQSLDFIAQNPPRMGVNWHCTMDVGIRTANLVLAYWLFAAQGCVMDTAFTDVFVRSIREHCHHIHTNLEWSEILTSNHYLADICGLLFGAAFLPFSKEQEAWLTFAAKEICQELEKQFHEEGSNFEGSVAYHRLSSDMAAYSMALIQGLGVVPAAQLLLDRLYGAGEFLKAVTRPDGRFVQVGDNDSGLFFRLSPTGQMRTPQEAKARYASLSGYQPESGDAGYYDEEMNDPGPTVSALSGLFFKDSAGVSGVYPLERSLVRGLLGKSGPNQTHWQAPVVRTDGEPETPLAHTARQRWDAPGEDLTRGLSVTAFPQFGIYVFRSPRMYLLVNGADNGQKGNGGHAHNDKLSLELVLDGKVLAEDPGVYVYTASEEMRAAYRSGKAHATIDTGVEQNEFLNTFAMKAESRCALLSLTGNEVCVQVRYQGITHRRTVRILPDGVEVYDACSVPFTQNRPSQPMTAGYGKRLGIEK